MYWTRTFVVVELCVVRTMRIWKEARKQKQPRTAYAKTVKKTKQNMQGFSLGQRLNNSLTKVVWMRS